MNVIFFHRSTQLRNTSLPCSAARQDRGKSLWRCQSRRCNRCFPNTFSCMFDPLQGLLALVHRWGYGWDGVHWGRVQHEWFGLWVPAVPRCYCWRGGWIRRGGGRIWRMNQDMKTSVSGNSAQFGPASLDTADNWETKRAAVTMG